MKVRAIRRGLVWLTTLAVGPAGTVNGCARAHALESLPRAHAALPAKRAIHETKPHAQIDGRAFPDGVLALTWDDGPEAGSFALAQYLADERVSATFFVVSEWVDGVSSDPGFGKHVYDSGAAHLPLLADLVALGHRLGNHTLHHALLGAAPPEVVIHELADHQHALDAYDGDEMRLFRVPGGYWTGATSRIVDTDPYLATLVGPVRWDVDAKDWEGAVWCEPKDRTRDCERADGFFRVRPAVMARRYEAAIDSARHGVVLMHDRVGDVASGYALAMAHVLIPRLIARGYVFAAPVLAFSTPRVRWTAPTCDNFRLADIDGDGRADACVLDGPALACARSSEQFGADGLRLATFVPEQRERSVHSSANAAPQIDVDGDRRADSCFRHDGVLRCTASRDNRALTAGVDGAVRFGDLNGDGRTDVCVHRGDRIDCAFSNGRAFTGFSSWARARFDAESWALGDVNGDGRADACWCTSGNVWCAIAP